MTEEPRTVSDFNEMLTNWMNNFATRNGTAKKWMAVSIDELRENKHLKPDHRLFTDTANPWGLTMSMEGEPQLYASNPLTGPTPTTKIHHFVHNNPLDTEFTLSSQVKHSSASTTKKSVSVGKSGEVGARFQIPIPGLTFFETTIKGVFAETNVSESTSSTSDERTYSENVLLQPRSRNLIESRQTLSWNKEFVDAKAVVSGSLLVCFSKKIELKGVQIKQHGKHLKWVIPLDFIKNDIATIQQHGNVLDCTGFTFLNGDRIRFVRREYQKSQFTSEKLSLVSWTSLGPSAPQNAAQAPIPERTNRTNELVVISVDGAGTRLEMDDAGKFVLQALPAMTDAADRLGNKFFSQEASNKFVAFDVKGGADVKTTASALTTIVEQKSDHSAACHLDQRNKVTSAIRSTTSNHVARVNDVKDAAAAPLPLSTRNALTFVAADHGSAVSVDTINCTFNFGGSIVQLPLFEVGHDRDMKFVGRGDHLTWLKQQFATFSENESTIAALIANHGYGKTQVALEYCFQARHNYDVVWWIRAGAIQEDFANLARALNVSVQLPSEAKLSEVKQKLNKLKKWLLIFDDVDSETVFHKITKFTPHLHGHVLILSTSDRVGKHYKSKQLDVFETSESLMLLRKIIPESHIADAVQLNELAEQLLGNMPLAVVQAASYIATSPGITVSGYIELFKKERRMIWLYEQWPVNYDKKLTVEAAFSVSLNLLAEMANSPSYPTPDIVHFLNYIGFLSGSSISYRLLRRLSKGELDCNQKVISLQELSIVNRNDTKGGIKIHTLLQTVIRDRMQPPDTLALILNELVCAITKDYPFEGGAEMYYRSAVFRQIQVVLSYDPEREFIAPKGLFWAKFMSYLTELPSYTSNVALEKLNEVYTFYDNHRSECESLASLGNWLQLRQMLVLQLFYAAKRPAVSGQDETVRAKMVEDARNLAQSTYDTIVQRSEYHQGDRRLLSVAKEMQDQLQGRESEWVVELKKRASTPAQFGKFHDVQLQKLHAQYKEDPTDVLVQSALCLICKDYAIIYQQNGDNENAIKYVRMAHEIKPSDDLTIWLSELSEKQSHASNQSISQSTNQSINRVQNKSADEVKTDDPYEHKDFSSFNN